MFLSRAIGGAAFVGGASVRRSPTLLAVIAANSQQVLPAGTEAGWFFPLADEDRLAADDGRAHRRASGAERLRKRPGQETEVRRLAHRDAPGRTAGVGGVAEIEPER